MNVEFIGDIEDIGRAHFNIDGMNELDVARQIMSQSKAISATPVESYLRGTPYYGSKSPFHNGDVSSVWQAQRHGMWDSSLQYYETTIGYDPSCPMKGCVVPAMVLRLQCLRTKEFCGIQATHIDPNTALVGGLRTIIYGQGENAICPVAPHGWHGHLIIGVGHEPMLRAFKEFEGDCGCIVPYSETLPYLSGITSNMADKVTIAVPANSGEAVHSARTLIQSLLHNGLNGKIVTVEDTTNKEKAHAANVSFKELNND